MTNTKNSQLQKFYKKSLEERQKIIRMWTEQLDGAVFPSLGIELANTMIENVVGIHGLPIGIATNFVVNGKDYLIPMVIEEPSVVAAASNAAKMFRKGGGFQTSSDEPIMIGQIQLLDYEDEQSARTAIEQAKADLIEKANEVGGSILKRGGGVRDIVVRSIESPGKPMLIIHVLMDTRDAMGANAINTTVEHLAPSIEKITGGRVNLKILSNLTDTRRAKAWGIVPKTELGDTEEEQRKTAAAIEEASVFAEIDPYRAATHNKGIMNGIDAVVIATGNDWRAIEAGAHAFAARRGAYASLSKFRVNADGDITAELEMPMAVGIVGGATKVHPSAQYALKLMGIESARELAEVIVAVGLAQNFAAVKALASKGIQHGHMRMHARQLAAAAGASHTVLQEIVDRMIDEGNIRLERAVELVREFDRKGLA
jgi:hydroxymethylglutaryl-CoA reductase